MRFGELFFESFRAMRAARAASSLIVLVCAAMCAASIMTVGRTAAADEQLESRLDSVGARSIGIASDSSGHLPVSLVDLARSLSTTERALGVHRISDVFNSSVGWGTPAPIAVVSGEFSDFATLTNGRAPLPGEAVLTESGLALLGFDEAIGSISDSVGNTYPLVGTLASEAPFGGNGVGFVMADRESDIWLSSIQVVTSEASDAVNTQSLLLSALSDESRERVEVVSPQSLTELRVELRSDFGDFSESLLLMILLGGGALLGIVVFSDSLLHRKDFGRRRALGITRSTLVALVTFRTLWASVFGVLAGTALAWGYMHMTQVSPPLGFVASVSYLVILVSAVCAAIPATAAAYRDPVSVLRTA